MARVWDAETGRLSTPPLIHEGNIRFASFSLDGRRILTASEGHTARVWDAETGNPLTPPLYHQKFITSASFSPDGGRVLTASWDGTARVWDAGTGRPLTPPLTHANKVYSAAFGPAGNRVVTASHDGTARVWNIGPDERPAEDLLRLAQLLSAHRIDDAQGVLSLSAAELHRHWDDLRARYPADFTVTPAQALAWRTREAASCAGERNWFALRLHLSYLTGELLVALADIR
jgi:dipeptidyl aminopeptidase/acylaminoacyl peptidase